MLRGDLPIQGIHDEVIRIIGANMDVIGPDCKRRHVEIPVIANGEVLPAAVEPGAIESGNRVPAISVTGHSLDRFERPGRGRISRSVHVVVALGLIIENHATRVVPFLIVNAGIRKVWSVRSRGQFIDRNEGGLDDRNIRTAIGIVRIGVLRDLEAVWNIVAVGIRIQRV